MYQNQIQDLKSRVATRGSVLILKLAFPISSMSQLASVCNWPGQIKGDYPIRDAGRVNLTAPCVQCPVGFYTGYLSRSRGAVTEQL